MGEFGGIKIGNVPIHQSIPQIQFKSIICGCDHTLAISGIFNLYLFSNKMNNSFQKQKMEKCMDGE